MIKCRPFHVFILYFILSVILTYPLIFLNDGLIGPKEDNLQSYWNAWHFNKSIFSANEALFFTKDLFYPSGTSLLLHTLSPLNLGLEFIFNSIFSLPYSYNLVIFLSFPLSAFFTFLLCLYFTKDKGASFVGGVIFAFSPYHVVHAVHHINLSTICFFPLLALMFFKLKDKPSIKYTLLLSLILLLTAFTDYYYLIYSFAFLFLGLVYFTFFCKETDKRFFKYVIYSMLIAILFISPLIVSTLIELKNNNYEKYHVGYSFFVLDLFSFITPIPLHPVFGKFTENIYGHFTGNLWESTGYLGFTALFLLIFGWCKNNERKRDKDFFILLFYITIVLSFGPTIHVLGHFAVSGIPLPYYLLTKTPILNMLEVSSRWIILGYLSLSILAAFGLKELIQKFSKGKKAILYLIILSLIIFEYLAIPLEYTKIEVPSFYYTIAKDDSDYAILDIPCNTNWSANNEYMFLQTIHDKKLLFANISRTSKEMFRFLNTTGIFGFCHLNKATTLNKDLLKGSKIKYIILHKEYLNQGDILSLTNILQPDFDHIFEDRNIRVYEVY